MKEIEKLKPKVNELVEKNKQIEEINKQVEIKEKEIFNLYEQIFKNFVSKRIETNIWLEEAKNNNSYSYNEICLNEEGFSLKYTKYYDNSNYIIDFNKLFKISKQKDKILKFIVNKTKKKMVRRFFKCLKLIKDIDFELKKEIKKPIKLIFYDERDIKNCDNIKYYISNLNFYSKLMKPEKLDVREWDINLSNFCLEDYQIVEQHFCLIRNFLNEYHTYITKMLNQRTKAVDLLKKEFINELLLNQLKTKN
jgi:hypothetical protein